MVKNICPKRRRYVNIDAQEHSLILRPCIPDCIIISYLIATPNNYRIIARSGYWKYDHECRKTHQIKRVCGTCYAHEFNLNAFRHEWSYIQYSRRAIDYYIYFIDENKRYSRKFRWTTQQNTSKLGTFVNFMCVYKCPVRSQ